MIRNFKVLGVVALAVFAFTALSAGSATASGERFHSSQAHTILTAEGTTNQVFTTTTGTITCTKVTGGGTTTEMSSSQITAENVKYTECTTKSIFGDLGVIVEVKGCDFLFTADTSRPTHVVCPAGTGPITITIPILGCTITVNAQTLSGVTYSNSGSHVNINANVNNITSTATGSFCPATGVHTHGTYTGTVTVKGATTAGAAVGVSYS